MKVTIIVEDVDGLVNVACEHEGEVDAKNMTPAEKLANSLMHKAADLIGDDSIH